MDHKAARRDIGNVLGSVLCSKRLYASRLLPSFSSRQLATLLTLAAAWRIFFGNKGWQATGAPLNPIWWTSESKTPAA